MTNEREQEILNITSEECAEIIQAISKINRFGLDNLKPGKPKTNRGHLEEEVGDLMAMIDLLIDSGLIDGDGVQVARLAKHDKLRQWSRIYVD